MDPFSRLSSTNAPLHALEVASVKDEIAARMAAIRKLEEEVKKYQALLSPLREFPTEILGEVFMSVLASIDKPCDIPNPIVTLSLVCKTYGEP